MKFIRDNIVKIALVFGILIVIVIVLIACSGGGTNAGKARSYSKIEDNFKSAATKFLSSHKDLLPSEEGKIVQIQMDTVYNEKQMKKIVSPDDETVRCDGYVNVSYKISGDEKKSYRIVPYIKCGDLYETENLYTHILKNENLVTELDGLYKIGNEYIYRGEKPNNYLMIGEKSYRILSMDEEGYIKIINDKRISYSSVWDDRYNVNTSKRDGINDYYVSRMRESLNEIYNSDEYISEDERNLFVKHDYCTGKRSLNNDRIDKFEECTTTINEDYLYLPLLYDFYIVSSDSSCKTIYSASCVNYNYLYNYLPFYTNTGVRDDTYQVFNIDETAYVSKGNRGKRIKYVAYLLDASYVSGNGTEDNPYIVK